MKKKLLNFHDLRWRTLNATGMFMMCLLFFSGLGISNAQIVNTVADEAYAGFNNAFLHQAGGLTFYKTSLTNTEKDYFWQQALDIQSAQDNYFRTNSPANKTLITDLLNAFLQQNKSNNTNDVQTWEWNDFNDDLFWATLAFCRGYEYTGNANFLSQAEYGFNLAYYHNGTGNWGWDNQLGGGLWWSRNKKNKDTLSNGPAIVSACYLYQFTGDEDYLDKAKQIYAWLRATLFNPDTGEVFSNIAANGDVNNSVNVFNTGSFGGAANFLYQITGDINYFNDSKLAFDYIKNTMFKNGTMYATSRGGTENAEYIRWLGEFVRQNNLWDEYYPWMKTNADRAWLRRNNLNVTWNDWRTNTPNDNSSGTNESNSAVVIQEVTPIIQAIPATIQAENYNFMKGIATETTTDIGGGLNIGSLDTGDYLEYVLEIPTSGLYVIDYRIASASAGSVSLLHNGHSLATTALPSTGGAQIWQNVSTTVNLIQGRQSIRLLATVGGWGINKLDITKSIGCDSSGITAYQNINNEGMLQASSSTLNIGQSIVLSPESPDVLWSWSGPNGFSASTREITIGTIQINQGGTYRATSTNACGANSTQNFYVKVNPPCVGTPIIPYINANTDGWLKITSTTSAVGGRIEFGPQPGTNGWRWTGPNGFTSTAREFTINNIQTNQFGTYTATFTNECGAETTQDFVVTNTLSVSTPIDDSKNDSFYMYPNPNEAMLNIKLYTKEYSLLRIFTSTGVLVYSKQLDGQSALKIDTSTVLKTGIYFVTLKSNNKMVTKKLIVK